jgi:hypothetical protein
MKLRIAAAPLVLLCLSLCLALAPAPATADGMMFEKFQDGWRPIRENAQDVWIAHRDGMQRMIVAVSHDAPVQRDMVWLLPVPADPKAVGIDILAELPSFYGREVFQAAKDTLGQSLVWPVIMEIWPLGVGLVFTYFRDPDHPARAAAPAIAVHQHAEKEGIVSEVITAKDGSAIYEYLAGKGLTLKAGAIPMLDWYVGKDYAFVASWAAPSAPAFSSPSSSARGIEVRFPVKNIFFPLLPTSLYGEHNVPATIRVAGYVTPSPFADIRSYTKVDYYVFSNDSRSVSANSFNEFFVASAGNRYTKIDINAPAKAYTQDLWIETALPARIDLQVATLIATATGWGWMFAVYLAFCSAFSSVLAGTLLLKEMRSARGAARLGLIGLANCLTFLVFFLAANRLIRQRKMAFIILFSLIFLLAATSAQLIGLAWLDPARL